MRFLLLLINNKRDHQRKSRLSPRNLTPAVIISFNFTTKNGPSKLEIASSNLKGTVQESPWRLLLLFLDEMSSATRRGILCFSIYKKCFPIVLHGNKNHSLKNINLSNSYYQYRPHSRNMQCCHDKTLWLSTHICLGNLIFFMLINKLLKVFSEKIVKVSQTITVI